MQLTLQAFRRLALVVGLGLAAANWLATAEGASTAERPGVMVPDSQLTRTELEGIEGGGLWLKLGCLGCGAGILLAGGSSVVGFIALGGAFPHLVAGCATACIAAFGADELL